MKTYAFICSLMLCGCVTVPTAEDRREDMLDATVRITITGENGNGSGTGVAFYSDDEKTLILTANHVAEVGSMQVQFVGPPNKYDAHIVKTHKATDLAIIEIASGNHPIVKLYRGDEIDRMVRVYCTGSGRGAPLHMSEGYTSLTTSTDIIVTCDQVGGNSGGGIYVWEDGDHQLIGIIKALLLTGAEVWDARFGLQTPFVARIPVYHIGVATNIRTIHAFIDGKTMPVDYIPIESHGHD